MINFLSNIKKDSIEKYNDGGFSEDFLFKDFSSNDKLAILLVHFGTTYKDTWELTISKFYSEVAKIYSNIHIAEAYTSRIIIRKLKERGIEKLTPSEAMENLKKMGFTHILVQSTHIINGIENDALKDELDVFKKDFKYIRIGMPLLSTLNDYKEISRIIAKDIGALANNEAVVLVAHGTHHHASSAYTMMEFVFQEEGYKNFFIGTIEGYPDMQSVVNRLNKNNIKKIKLLPFMFVAGNHSKIDIARDWYEKLKELGFEVEFNLKGLGEYDEIRRIFLEHINFMVYFIPENMKNKKIEYLQGVERY